MAEAKTNTTRKRTTTPRTTKKVEDTPVVEKMEVVEQAQTVRQKKVQIDRDELVRCRNITGGRLTYISKKTGLQVIWTEHDDYEEIDVGELLTMKSSQPKFLNKPWIVVEDEEVAEYLGLKQLYKDMADTEDLDAFFDKPTQEMSVILDKIPQGTKDAIAVTARKKIEDETLYDNRKIKLLEDKLKIDLSILS